MRLSTGTHAPPFEGLLHDGGTLSLDEAMGARGLWLAFYRYVGCPLCNLRLHKKRQRFDAYRDRGLGVVAVMQSPPERVAPWLEESPLPFPVVCDPSESLYARYGVESGAMGIVGVNNVTRFARAALGGFVKGEAPDGTFTRVPADFLIRPDGMVADAFYGREISDHIPFERVDRFLAAAG